jgi:putative endonuclease
MTTKLLGEKGERLAEDYLKAQGYRILERNYRIRMGEIDLIARHGDCICFVEVKARAAAEAPQEAVGWHKQRKLARLAQAYLKSKFDTVDVRCRFDVVAVSGTSVSLIPNAFEVIS